MTSTRPLATLAVAIAIGSGLSAQTSPPPARGQRLIEVTRAAEGEAISCMRATQNGAVPTRDGALFVAVARSRPKPDSIERAVTVELWRSDDGGLAWRRAAQVSTPGAGDLTMVPDGELLSCLWTAGDGQPFSSVFWQRYDPRTDQWVGEPVAIERGSSRDDYYCASDLVRTAGGALVAVIGNGGAVRAPAWNCSWSSGMRWLPAGATEWAPLVQVNAANYGCCANAIARGDLVDITYRTCPHEAIHGLRSVDARTGKLVQENDVNAANDPVEDRFIANVGVLCVDGTGGRSLLHLIGAKSPGRGRLAVSWSMPDGPVRTTEIAADAPLQAGNENPMHYTLARGPGNQVFAYFAKVSEEFSTLWQCVVEEGLPVGEARRVVVGKPNAFLQLSGMRASDAFCGLHVVTLGRAEGQGGGVVSVFGSWPARAVWARHAPR
jgi:hypothetical protein